MTNPNPQKPVAPAPELTEADINPILQQAANGGDLDDASFKALLQLMMLKEKRLIQKEADLERLEVERDKAARQSSEQFTISKIESQKNCRHLKGGKTRARGQQKDPAVYAHTFTDGTTVIKCQLCSAKWMKNDTKEYLQRNGNAIPNWTNIGWNEALELAAESSNRPSSSERFFIERSDKAIPKTDKGKAIADLQL